MFETIKTVKKKSGREYDYLTAAWHDDVGSKNEIVLGDARWIDYIRLGKRVPANKAKWQADGIGLNLAVLAWRAMRAERRSKIYEMMLSGLRDACSKCLEQGVNARPEVVLALIQETLMMVEEVETSVDPKYVVTKATHLIDEDMEMLANRSKSQCA